jgi:hypothetical protein
LSKLQQQKSKQNDVGLRLCFQRRQRRDDGALSRSFILQRLCVIELCWM